MRLKTRIATTIMSMALALGVMTFAVYAAATQTLSVTNTVSFVSQHVLATVTGWVTGAYEGSFTDYTELTRGEGKTTTTADDDDGVLGTWEIGDNMQFANENAPIFVNITVKNNSLERRLSFELIGYQYGAWNGIDLGDKNIDRAVTYSIDNEVPASGTYAGGEAQVEPLATATIVIRLDITNTGKSVSAFDNSFTMKLRNIGENTVYGPGEEPGEGGEEPGGEEPGEGNFVFSEGAVTIPAGEQLTEQILQAMLLETAPTSPAYFGLYTDDSYLPVQKVSLPYPSEPSESETTLHAKFGAVPTYLLFTLIENDTEYSVEQNGEMPTMLEIPSCINGIPVTVISDGGFSGIASTSVSLSDFTKRIGDSAFSDSSLTSLTIPSSVTILGAVVLLNTSVTSIIFEDNSQLTSIDPSNFPGIEAPYSINFGANSSLITIHDGAFAGAMNLTAITLPENLLTIGNNSFLSTGLTSIEIPASVTSIGVGAFDGTQLQSLAFENNSNLATIGAGAFISGTYTSVAIPASVSSIGNRAFWANSLENVVFEDNSSMLAMQSEMFKLTNLQSVNFGNNSSVTTLSVGAFTGASKLTTVNFGANSALATIGNAAFASCSALTSITLPEGLITISDVAFYGAGLTSINIPASVTSIGDSAFCIASLAQITFAPNSNLTTIKNSAFAYGSYTTITIPASVSSVIGGAFYTSSLEVLMFEDNSSLTSVSPEMFNVSSLQAVYFGNNSSLETINVNTFSGASNLTTVDFGANSLVTTIGTGAFLGASLTEITLPESLTIVTYNKLTFGSGSWFMERILIDSATIAANVSSLLHYGNILSHLEAGSPLYIRSDVPTINPFIYTAFTEAAESDVAGYIKFIKN